MPGVLDTIDGGLYVVTGGEYFKLMTFSDRERAAHRASMEAYQFLDADADIPPNLTQHLFRSAPPRAVAIPSVFSRREEMTAARHQGSRGSCTAFGACSQHEFNWRRTRDFSEQQLYWGAKQIENSSEGTWIKDAWASLLNRGICKESTHPYTSTQPYPKWGGPDPGQAAHTEALSYRGKQNWWINNADVNLLKRCISELGYVITVQVTVWWSTWPSSGIVNMPTAAQLDQTQRLLSSIVVDGASPSDGEHVICLCGYSDVTSRFEFKNSWGVGWGASGFGSIPYDYVRLYARDATVFQSN
ncbi:C1 family peptidase [uncultured Hyphomicrobium sp.]|uniref:C1 family peptidase n=1 Tax=uncultured Hyphomicrobium sp. TaxID=194373 RepID=UPI0025FB5BC5|nr:C1 family peptidase [uncultured Hyphomicrobium sp.]